MNEEHEKLFTGAKIPKQEVLTMIKEFRKHSRKHPNYKKGDHVKSVWFDAQKVKELCEEILTEGGDGLRIYFGRYPNVLTNFVKNEELIPNSNTVILVSTKKVNNINKDYFTKLVPSLKGKDTEPENRGEQCQPHCDGTTDDGENEEDPIV